MPQSSSRSSPHSVHSPAESEPFSPPESNHSLHSNQSAVSVENGLNSGSVSVLTHMRSHSPASLSRNHIKSEMLSRDTSTPSSIIDPGDERDNCSSDEEYFKPYKRLRMQESNEDNEEKESNESLPLRPLALESRQLASPSNEANEANESDKPLTSFLIKDILSHKPKICTNVMNSEGRGIVRPWDLDTSQHNTLHHNHSHHNHNNHHINTFGRICHNRRPRSADDDSRSERSESDSSESPTSNGGPVGGVLTSPLDALFQMTTKAFDGIDGSEKSLGKPFIAFVWHVWGSVL